ncbi:MAG: phosphogluconate dehydrogenase (NAD(+)-dependent, decarboxylating) [Armatimonadota bacterium]
MELGFYGLGRMGMNMVLRLLRDGHRVVAYNRTQEKVRQVEKHGAVGASSVEEMVRQLSPPRTVWLMLPAGDVVEYAIREVAESLEQGDVIVDGGNSNYRDTIRRAEELRSRGLQFVDVGTSGGIWGLHVGYCLMIGGDEEAVQRLEPIFASLAPQDGYLHCGPNGAGHFVKMVHNGIEYGLLQAYGEGFEILRASDFDLDLRAISHLWNQGSVVRSWLLELAERAFEKDPDLDGLTGYVEDSGEGRWTVLEAIDKDVPAPIITLSLLARFRSRQVDSFSAKVIAALRREFGGHAVRTTGS